MLFLTEEIATYSMVNDQHGYVQREILNSLWIYDNQDFHLTENKWLLTYLPGVKQSLGTSRKQERIIIPETQTDEARQSQNAERGVQENFLFHDQGSSNMYPTSRAQQQQNIRTL